jgi:hypothetical protein
LPFSPLDSLARFIFTMRDLAAFWKFRHLNADRKPLKSIEAKFEAIAREIHPQTARGESLHSMNVSLQPCFVLDELNVSPRECAKKGIEMIDGSVLG